MTTRIKVMETTDLEALEIEMNKFMEHLDVISVSVKGIAAGTKEYADGLFLAYVGTIVYNQQLTTTVEAVKAKQKEEKKK